MGPEALAQAPPDEQGYELHFHLVRMCQTPEVCTVLPPEAITLAYELPVPSCAAENHDNITATALRQLIPVDQAEDYAALAAEVTSRFTKLVSNQVAWVEIEDNGRKSVVQRFSRPGLRLTPATYRRVKDGLLPDATPDDLTRRVQTG
eukprot:6205956-Pleurochrysis_carterae.AAC.2